MESEILFVPSAFKHGCTVEDIRRAFDMKIDEGLLKGRDGVYFIAGFDCIARPIEVLYNVIDDETVRVFHAMPMRGKITAK